MIRADQQGKWIPGRASPFLPQKDTGGQTIDDIFRKLPPIVPTPYVRKTPLVKSIGKVTHVFALLDKSGSMTDRANEVIGGFNEYIDEQKKVEGETKLTLAFFNTSMNVVCNDIYLEQFNKLDNTNYTTIGGTALNDSLVDLIRQAELKVNKDDNVIFIIITDGEENSSRRFSKSDVKKLVESHQELGWVFIYLAANIDAFAEAQNYGFKETHTSGYDATRDGGTTMAYAAASMATSQLKFSGKVDRNWKKDLDATVNKVTADLTS